MKDHPDRVASLQLLVGLHDYRKLISWNGGFPFRLEVFSLSNSIPDNSVFLNAPAFRHITYHLHTLSLKDMYLDGTLFDKVINLHSLKVEHKIRYPVVILDLLKANPLLEHVNIHGLLGYS